MSSAEIGHCVGLGAALLGVLQFVIYAVCRRNLILRRKYLLLAAIGILWLFVGVFKSLYSDRFNWVPDSIEHHATARQLGDLMLRGNFSSAAREVRANNSGFRFMLGVAYALTGLPPPTIPYMTNAAIMFTALLLLLDMITRVIPDVNLKLPVVLLVTMPPTALFWATAINKEALMLLGIVLMFRMILFFEERAQGTRFEFLTSCFGVLLSGFLRPHVAACWFFGIIIGLVISKKRFEIVLLGILALPGFFFAFQSFKSEILDRFESEGITETMANYARSGWGGTSEITRTSPPIPFVEGIGMLFLRPFPREIHSTAAALTSLEIWGLTSLLILGWLRIGTVRRLWNHPAVVCAAASILFLSFFFSYMANLGYMSRQRLQAFPAILTLIAAPWISRKRAFPMTLDFSESEAEGEHHLPAQQQPVSLQEY